MWSLIYVSIVGMSLHGPIDYAQSVRGVFDSQSACLDYAVRRNYKPFDRDNMPYYYCEKRQ